RSKHRASTEQAPSKHRATRRGDRLSGRLLEGGSPRTTAPRGRFRGGDSSKGVLHALRRRAVASAGETPRRGFSTPYGAARSLPRGRLLEGGSPRTTAPRGRFRGADPCVHNPSQKSARTPFVVARRSGGWGRGAASRRPPGTRRSGRGSS